MTARKNTTTNPVAEVASSIGAALILVPCLIIEGIFGLLN